jgi:hypothetical protein
MWLCYHAFNSINRHQFGCNEIVALQEIQEIPEIPEIQEMFL